jgi:CheY-like chemotaxis protein
MKKQKIRILIVDDNLMWRKTLKLSFSTLPNVEAVDLLPDGRRAVAFCRQNQPDLIVLNINLPGMDVFQMTRELLEVKPSLWIIGVTADPSSPNASQITKESGIRAVVSKDVLLDYLPPGQFWSPGCSKKFPKESVE